ncbi:gag protease polyprotein [Cucumis melo var. makuwa]|uniref:Gag protease polyprotein n=1 Tax=Cucumis melo var. makuwa TaxID=1194695 RepID=A0A5D3C2I4_CUCMM|nr:gag protease polyprotein [Cucumis melo var. makuwa]TYK05504.1 gag protease polyprotein [Cucumis melo var. makuwa]
MTKVKVPLLATRLSAFQRLNTTAKKVQSTSPTPVTRESAFKRISVLVTRGQKKPLISVSSKPDLVTRDEEIRSAVLSRMKIKMFVLVNIEGSLKVKRHDVVFTRPENNEPEDEVDVARCRR